MSSNIGTVYKFCIYTHQEVMVVEQCILKCLKSHMAFYDKMYLLFCFW